MTRPATVAALLAVTTALAAGCVGRIPLYSPRLTPSDEHRAAADNGACLECHDPAARPSHNPTDDCRNCHTLPKES